MERNTIEINTITDTNGTLSKDSLCITEGDKGIHLAIETVAEQLVDLQFHAHRPEEVLELFVVGISGNLCDGTDASLPQAAEETDEPGIGILEAAGIDQFDAVELTVVEKPVVLRALSDAGHDARAVVGQHFIVDVSAAMTVGSKVVITEMHLMAALAQAFYLSMYLLRDTTHLTETVIDKEKYFQN